MSQLGAKLHVKKSGVQYDINLYSSKTDITATNSGALALPIKLSGKIYYASGTTALSNTVAGGYTPLRISKSGRTYQITKYAEHTIKANQQSNETISINVKTPLGGNYTFTDNNTHWVPYGSTYTCSIHPASGYKAGSLSSTSGTITKPVTITAGAAKVNEVTVTIIQQSGQTITVNYNGVNHTSTFKAAPGNLYTATISAWNNAIAGSLNTRGGTLTSNITVKATSSPYWAIYCDDPHKHSANYTIYIPAGWSKVRIQEWTNGDRNGRYNCSYPPDARSVLMVIDVSQFTNCGKNVYLWMSHREGYSVTVGINGTDSYPRYDELDASRTTDNQSISVQYGPLIEEQPVTHWPAYLTNCDYNCDCSDDNGGE